MINISTRNAGSYDALRKILTLERVLYEPGVGADGWVISIDEKDKERVKKILEQWSDAIRRIQIP